MKVGRLRWWWLQRTHTVLIPTSTEWYAGRAVDVHMNLTSTVPVYDKHPSLSCTFDEVSTGLGAGELMRGVAVLVEVKDGWGRYRCSVPLRGRTGSGDWRLREGELFLAAIALRPVDRVEPSMVVTP